MLISSKRIPSEQHPDRCLTKYLGNVAKLHIKLTITPMYVCVLGSKITYIFYTGKLWRYSGFGFRFLQQSKYCDKLSCNLFTGGRSCLNLYKITASVKYNKAKHNKVRYACSGCG